MLIIDLYAYCGHWPYWPIKTTTTEGLIHMLDCFKIDKAVVTSTRGVFVACAEGNQETAKLCNEQPERFIGFATVNPVDEKEACNQLVQAHTMGLKGLRLFPQHHGYRLDDDPFLAEILATAQDLGLPVLIPVRVMMNWGLPFMDVRQLENVVGQYPRLRFIIAGINYGELRDSLAIMRRHDNVGLETSCLQSYGGVKTVVDKVGAERIYLGTGLPLQYPAPGLAKIEHAEISDDAKELILGVNASRLLSL